MQSNRFHPREHWLAGIFVLLLSGLLGHWLLWQSGRDEPDFGPLPDLGMIDSVEELKQRFYAYLTPILAYHYVRIESQRAALNIIAEQYRENGRLTGSEFRHLRALAREYELRGDPPVDQVLRELQQRIDLVPLDLALSQAAKESAWGRSRFAVLGNNLFGQWCFRPGCGLIPADRAAGNRHEVERFDSVSESVRRYLNNLNTHRDYQVFRSLRQEQRQELGELSGLELADGLLRYSERREAYVEELKAMIRQYHEFNNSLEVTQ
jgi:Bax protein